MSGPGTERTCRPGALMSAHWGEADSNVDMPLLLSLTDTVEKVLVIFGEQ
jgi:hypothetical protein